MATTRIKDISKTTTDLASDTYGVFDGATNGTQKMARNDMYADWAAAYVAAPTTYKLAPLNSGTNKIDATYLPTSGDTPKGEWNANTNSPALADGSGTAGDYYDVTTAGTQDLGSGSIAYTVGDVVKYNGSTWYKIDSVANILDGSATAADGRSALSVNSIDEDAEATGTKLVGPALYFRGAGPNDYLQVADDSKLTFSSSAEFGTNSSGTWSPDDNTPALTDGTGTLNQHYRIDSGAGTVTQGGSTLSVINGTATTAGQAVYYDGSVWRLKDVDDLPFSVSGWINMKDATNFTVLGKYNSTPNLEWLFYINSSDQLAGLLQTSSGNFAQAVTTSVTSYEGTWIHVMMTYSGTSGGVFTAAQDGINLYINGILQSATKTQTGTYAGMSNTAQAVWLGRWGSTYSKGHIKDVKIFNRTLTADEIAQLARGNDLGFADEFGGSFGGLGTIDETTGVSSWSGIGSITTSNLTETANTTVGGRPNVLQQQATATVGAATKIAITSVASVGKRVRIEFDYYINSGNVTLDSILVASPTATIATLNTAGAWTRASIETILTSTTLELQITDGTSYNATALDFIGLDNFSITAIGTLADFRAENFIADKLIDLSSNNFVGTNNGATLVGGRKALQLDTDGAAAGNKVLSVFNGSSHLASITDKGDLDANSIGSGAATELTISSGAVTVTKSHHTIDTESDAASDDLDTINGGRAGQLLILRAANGARDVVLKDGTGNLKLSGDITLDNTEDTATLISDGTNWYLLATSNNGA